MNDEELRLREQSKEWYKKLSKWFREDDVFWNNEIKANMFVSWMLVILAGVMVLSTFLAWVGVFDVPIYQMEAMLLINLPILVFSITLCLVNKGQKHWVKYMLCFASLFVSVSMIGSLSIFVSLMVCIPVLLSTRYYSRHFTINVSVMTIIGMVIAEILYARYGMLDLNLVSIPRGSTLTVEGEGLRGAALESGYSQTTYVINLFRGSFAPRLLLFLIVAVICTELARRASEMVLEQAEVSKRTEGLKAELDMAKNIQLAVLPKIFPPFPTRPEIDIYATMDPAKEVGGDFYDYYFLDDDHLMIVIADVSGKGVPAALFMMISKILLKTYAYICREPGKIAAEVNRQLCEDNEVELFVTAWIGVLELSTGTMTVVDAGHEYPFLRHEDGNFEMVKGRKSFVLAGMETAKFREFTFHMEKGDTLFLYTDGVPEATDDEENQFGMERLEETLNANKDDHPKELLGHVRRTVDDFVKAADQFDDLTMVCLHYKGEA